MRQEQSIERLHWLNRLVFDAAGISPAERATIEDVLGVIDEQFVRPGENFEFGNVETLVFRWGDPRTPQIFGRIAEHRQDVYEIGGEILPTPFKATTIVGGTFWTLGFKELNYDAEVAFMKWRDFRVMPEDESSAVKFLGDYFSGIGGKKFPIFGKVGHRWVQFQDCRIVMPWQL